MITVRGLLTAFVVLLGTSSAGVGNDVPNCRQDPRSQKVILSEEPITVLRVALASEDTVEIQVITEEFEADSFPFTTRIGRYVWTGWGSQFAPPSRYISSLSITVSGRAVWVPLSAFSDLANARQLQFEETTVEESQVTFRVILSGGSKAATYTAVLDFNKGALERRSVWADAFPMEEREVTVYTMTTIRGQPR